MTEYFSLTSIPLTQLEKLVYSEDREKTYQNAPESNTEQMKFMLTLFSQLDLETAYNNDIHEKYKKYTDYMVKFEEYIKSSTTTPSLLVQSFPRYRKLYVRHAVTQLQVILRNLGADDDDIKRVDTFGETSIDNIERLEQYFLKLDPLNKANITSGLIPSYSDALPIVISKGDVDLTKTDDKNVIFSAEQKSRFFKLLIDGMQFYYYHSAPEPNSSAGFNTFAHLIMNQYASLLTTSAPSTISNPFELILTEYNRVINDKTNDTPGAWLGRFIVPMNNINGQSNNFYSSILFLIETGQIKYNNLHFFPSLTNFLDSINTPIDTSRSNLLLEMLQYQLEISAEIKNDDSKYKYYPHRNYARNFSDFNLVRMLSYEQLVKLQSITSKSVGLARSPQFLQLLLDKFIPTNFSQLRNNQDVAVISPYSLSPLITNGVNPSTDGRINTQYNITTFSYQTQQHDHFYPTRHILDTPIIINNSNDLEKYKKLIPSFLLTVMEIYSQIFAIIKTNLSASGNDGSIKSYYYSSLASYLLYTAQYNIWRFDLFNDILVPERLSWSSHFQRFSLTDFFTNAISFSANGFSTAIFPIDGHSFDTVMKTYITMYYSSPTVTTWNQFPLYSKNIQEDWLKGIFYNIKDRLSHVVIDISCDQKNAQNNNVIINNNDNINNGLLQIKRDENVIFTPQISLFDLKSIYPQEYSTINKLIEQFDLGTEYYHIKSGRNTFSSLKWGSSQPITDGFREKDLKNRFNIDQNGNIRTAIIAHNVNNITVNVYHLDIYSYYQSQLSKGQNVVQSSGNDSTSIDLDPNLDLEGLIPHYSTQIDLQNAIKFGNVKSYQDMNINLCIDSLPKRGVFMIEVLNGKDGIRCCVRKGQFNAIQKQINAGTLLILLNEMGQLVKNPRCYLGNDVFKPSNSNDNDMINDAITMADQNDNIVQKLSPEEVSKNFIFIPSYDTKKSLILTDNTHSFASCIEIEPILPSFTLSCDWFASVEALTSNSTPTNEQNDQNIVTVNNTEFSLRTGPSAVIGGGNMGAEVLIKPLLRKNNRVVELSAVNIVRSSLSIRAELEAGVTITDVVENFNLLPTGYISQLGNNSTTTPTATPNSNTMADDDQNNDQDSIQNQIIASQEILHTFNVPNNLSTLRFSLTCVVEFEGKEYNLTSDYTTVISQIQKTTLSTGTILLRRVNGIYLAYTVDKTGQSLPFVQLNITTQSIFNTSGTNHSLYTDVNGCCELGSLFGVTQLNLTTVTNEYSFIRGNFSYNLRPYHTVVWPENMNIIVNDCDIDITPNNNKNKNINPTSQVSLPLPTNGFFDLSIMSYYFNGTSLQKNSDKVKQTSEEQTVLYPFKNGLILSKNDKKQLQLSFLNFLFQFGAISFYETSKLTPIRQHCTHLLNITPTGVQVYGLKPNRTYILSFSFLGQSYETSINTYRNPLTRPTITHTNSFGTVLPQPLYFDKTLNYILDYLICKGKIIPLRDLSQQSVIDTIDYDTTTTTLSVQLGNYNPSTTKLLVFASHLITTPTTLLDLFSSRQRQQLDDVIASIQTSSISTGRSEHSDFVTGTSISGEREYVMYRRELIKSMKQVGIMLPQPTLLLNKRLRQHTEAIIDKPKSKAKGGAVDKKEKAYEEEAEGGGGYGSFKRQSRMNYPSSSKQSLGYGGSSYGNFPTAQFDNNFNNFDILKYKSSLLLNISPDKDGKVVIKRNGLNKYTTLTVIVYETNQTLTNSYGLNTLCIDIPQSTIRLPYKLPSNVPIPAAIRPEFLTDVSFTLTFQPDKQYTEEHRTGVIFPTKNLSLINDNVNNNNLKDVPGGTIIGPNGSVELEIVNSRQDLYALLHSLVQTTSTTSSPLLPRRQYPGNVTDVTTALQKYHFLQDWNLPQTTDNVKLTLLDRYACHELHLFIFFNDRIFFESVVRLHLSNKTLKSIVDLWLLSQAIAKTPFTTNPSNDDTIELLHDIKTQSRLTLSSKLGELSKLNIFEQILVLSIADNSGLNSLAKQLKTNIDENPSLSRNNLSWVTIFESCLRRTMLQLNTTLPDNDTDDKEQDAPKKPKKPTMDDDSSDESDGDGDDDHDYDYDEEEQGELYKCNDYEEEADLMLSTRDVCLDVCSMQLQSAPCPPPPPPMSRAAPPVPCAAPISSLSRRSECAAPQMLSKSMAAPSMLRSRAAVPSMDSIAMNYEKKEKPSSIPSYKPLEQTGEYEEKTWYIDPKYDGDASFTLQSERLVQWCGFWVDFALYLSNKDFFFIGNDFSTPERSNKAFASSQVLDLVNASANEYLLCLAVTQLSPVVIPKQATLATIKGGEVINTIQNTPQCSDWSILSTINNTTQPINNVVNSLAKGATFRYVKHLKQDYPIILLHKQVQQLKNDKKKKNVDANDKKNTNLSASHYYIDIFESIQKNRQIYVSPDQMYKRRSYLTKVVISNSSPEPVKSKVLITIPDGTTSVSYTPSTNTHGSSNSTHLNYLEIKTIYCTIPAYSSYVIQYSFLLGNRDSYVHYGATVTSTNDAVSELYCCVPSITLQSRDYKQITNSKDVITIAREANNDDLCSYLREYYRLNLQTEDMVSGVNVDSNNSNNNNQLSQLDDPSQQFKLNYILFRFNQTTAGSVNGVIPTLQQRWELYQRVYDIVRGYLTTHTKDGIGSEQTIPFVSYMLNFFHENALALSQNRSKERFIITKSQLTNVSHAFSILMSKFKVDVFSSSIKQLQHLEYLPLVAARIHNASIGTDLKTGATQQSVDKELFIPDKQLKEQYTKTLECCLSNSSSVKNIQPAQLLSLIYYAIILNQNVRVISLLQHLLNTLSEFINKKSKTTPTTTTKPTLPTLPITTRVQLAYMLIYIDVSTNGTLQSVLNNDQLNVIATLYNNKEVLQLPQSKQTTYGLSLLLAKTYEKYPIKQWKLLFLQTLQYLKDGQVVVGSEDEQQQSQSQNIIKAEDFDVNVAGASNLQRDLRQDLGANTTPSLSVNIHQSLKSTDVTLTFANLDKNEKEFIFDVTYIDSELLLSHKPFMTSGNQSSGSTNTNTTNTKSNATDQVTKPHLSIHIPIPDSILQQSNNTIQTFTVPIPSHLSKESQLTIRAPRTHISTTTPLLHSSLTVQVLSKQGIVAVLDTKTHKPVSGVYVKSYVDEGNKGVEGKFLCDKYTDIRGKASFVDASNNKSSNSNQKFALIVSHPEYGTTVVYTNGPQM